MSSLRSFLFNSLAGGGAMADYSHAAKTFRSDGFSNAGKYKFLFHVFFNINPDAGVEVDPRYLSFLVKSIELPKYTLDLKEMNQYNRKQLVQTRIRYNPINIRFQDDNGNEIRNLWRSYYNYYYADGRYVENAYYFDDKYTGTRLASNWGLNAGADVPFFNSIEIYSMHAGEASRITLINPMINSFNHDTHDYADGSNLLEHNMSVTFTSVKYADGYAAGIPGFADSPFYDQFPSSLAGDYAGYVLDPITGNMVAQGLDFNDPIATAAQVAARAAQQQFYYNNPNALKSVSINSYQTDRIVENNNQINNGQYSFPTIAVNDQVTINATNPDVNRQIVGISENDTLFDQRQFIGVFEKNTWQRALEEKGYDPRNINIAAEYIDQGIRSGELSYVTNDAIAQKVAEKFLSDPIAVNQYSAPVYAARNNNFNIPAGSLTSYEPVYEAESWQATLATKGYTPTQIAYAAQQLSKIRLAPGTDIAIIAENIIKQSTTV